jgi:hypothetical protein
VTGPEAWVKLAIGGGRMEDAATSDPLIGSQVGNYQIKSKLGEGGMGAVYLAEHPRIGKKVALKVLHPEFSANLDITDRFFNEARAVNDIGHPNIVDVIDYGVIPGAHGRPGMVYFIMELLAGLSLAEVIRDQSPIGSDRALAIALQIADALAASHRHRIIHRDLKPDNVILLSRGVQRDFVKVLDFGIAKLTGDQPGSRRTRTGIVMGTPAYMSPEQCEGRGAVDPRTDVYALGIVLYEMMTGVVPFQGEGYGEVLLQHMTAAPRPPSTIRGDIPRHVELVCLKALEKRPDARYASMDELILALRDPVGYVESHGGVHGFTTPNLGAPMMTGQMSSVMPVAAPPSAVMPAASYSAAMATPAPGTGTYGAAATPGSGMPGATGGYPTPPPAARSRMPVIAVVGGLVAVLAGTAVVIMKRPGGEAKAEAPRSNGERAATAEARAPAAAAVTPAAARKVDIAITSNPPGAEVWRDGIVLGNAPVKLALPQSDERVELVLKLAGYEERRAAIVPSESRDLSLDLTALPSATHAAAATVPDAKPEAAPGAAPADKPRPTARAPRPRAPRAAHDATAKPPASKPAVKVGDNTLEPDF